MRRSRLPKKKYELCVYHGGMGVWQRVKSVDSIKEAERYLSDKRFHSAELFSANPPNRLVKSFSGRRPRVAWLK